VYADGAYHSPENQNYCKDNDIHLNLQAIQGSQRKIRVGDDGGPNIASQRYYKLAEEATKYKK
jgi:hypothetical protein